MAAHRLDEIGGQFTACWWCLLQSPVTASSSILLQAQRFLLPVSKDGMCKSASIALIKLRGFFFRCESQCSANGPRCHERFIERNFERLALVRG